MYRETDGWKIGPARSETTPSNRGWRRGGGGENMRNPPVKIRRNLQLQLPSITKNNNKLDRYVDKLLLKYIRLSIDRTRMTNKPDRIKNIDKYKVTKNSLINHISQQNFRVKISKELLETKFQYSKMFRSVDNISM